MRPESEVAGLSIAQLRLAQQRGELTAVEVALDRLQALEVQRDTVNAVVAWNPDDVLAQAAKVDARRRRGDPLGTLAGIPVTVKDSFAVAGLPGSIGTRETVHTSTQDAPAVARWRSAGAVLLGKTNIPAYLDAADSANPVYGRTLNPWSPAHTAGGSSGGSAAAVSAGLSWGDLGSDLSGSIRVPASWCGVFGHRPSTGVVSKRGHLPWPIHGLIDPTASAAGSIARTADDLIELFTALAGADGPEARIWRLDLPPARFTGLAGLRIGLWRDEASAPIDAETAGALEDLASQLLAAGCTLQEIRHSVLATGEAERLFDRLINHEISYGADLDHGRLDAPAATWTGASVAEAWADWDAQRRLRAEWERVFDTVDIVLAPSTSMAAPPIDQVTTPGVTVQLNGRAEPLARLIGRWSCMANLGMGPSTAIPVALSAGSGLPLGVQAIGRFGDDLSTLTFASLLAAEGLLPQLRPPALVTPPRLHSS